MIISELRKRGYEVKMNTFTENQSIGDLLDAITNVTSSRKKSTSTETKVPFVRQFQPGKTFDSDPETDTKWRTLISNIIADSFIESEPMAIMINLKRESMFQICMSKIKQAEEAKGLIFVAGSTQSDPNGPLDDLYNEVSAVIMGLPYLTPIAPNISDPLYICIEKAFEICDSQAEELRNPSKCFSSALLGARRNVTGKEMIQLVIFLEEHLSNGAKKLGFDTIRSINTAVVTRVRNEYRYMTSF